MNRSAAVLWKAGYFNEYGEQVLGWLNSAGWDAVHEMEFPKAGDYDLIVVVGMHFYPRVPWDHRCMLVGIQSEQLPLPGDTDWSLYRNQKRLAGLWRYYDLVIEWSPANYRWYPRAAPVRYLPYGCQRNQSSGCCEPKYDVLFLGNPDGSDGRRARILADLRGQFRVCPTHYAWAEQKAQLISESAVCLNLHQFHSQSFESPRIFELLAAGACVLTEKIADSFPFTDGRDFLSFSTSAEAAESLCRLLQDEELRKRLAENGRAAAYRFEFSVLGGLLMQELHRLCHRRRNFISKLGGWGRARIASMQIDCIDSLARMKRNFL